ncbi:hypothetical protein Hdeb2414_s0001g00026071 [Helianthus debilis subsp. tardiflorus]
MICVEGCANRDLGLDLAKVLDVFGSVIVLGDAVLRLNRIMLSDSLNFILLWI